MREGMGRISISKALEERIICCPACRKSLTLVPVSENEVLQCTACQSRYPISAGSPLLIMPVSGNQATKEDIQVFWGELYKAAYAHNDEMKPERLAFSSQLKDLERLFRHREHLAVEEMPIHALSGEKILEIGSGAGVHSVYFSSKGAHVVSMDITLERVEATAAKLDCVGKNGANLAVQGDAERLPFEDGTFDIVYSNGVLHHTPKTDQAVREVFRVLKPGGKAVIMLYAKHSFYYWFTIFFLKGLVMGNYFRSRNWLGLVTEWMPRKRQTVFNPETKVYSKREVLQLFSDFNDIKIRKNSFSIQQVPILGKVLSRLIGRFTGYNPAGALLYGESWRNEARWELAIGRHWGFGLNILAQK